MANSNEDHATLASYAQALLELADARQQTQQVAEDVAGVAQVIEQDDVFRQYLADPSISHTERAERLERIFGPQVVPVLLAFLKLLNTRNRLAAFPGIAKVFRELIDEREGNIDVQVSVAQALTPEEFENVRQQISQKLGKNARVTQNVDESLIGGLVLRVGDSLIDGSVKTQLETLKKRMIAAV